MIGKNAQRHRQHPPRKRRLMLIQQNLGLSQKCANKTVRCRPNGCSLSGRPRFDRSVSNKTGLLGERGSRHWLGFGLVMMVCLESRLSINYCCCRYRYASVEPRRPRMRVGARRVPRITVVSGRAGHRLHRRASAQCCALPSPKRLATFPLCAPEFGTSSC